MTPMYLRHRRRWVKPRRFCPRIPSSKNVNPLGVRATCLSLCNTCLSIQINFEHPRGSRDAVHVSASRSASSIRGAADGRPRECRGFEFMSRVGRCIAVTKMESPPQHQTESCVLDACWPWSSGVARVARWEVRVCAGIRGECVDDESKSTSASVREMIMAGTPTSW